MKNTIFLLAVLAIACISFSYITVKKEPRILVFSKTKGFRHTSINPGKEALQLLAESNGFKIDTTEDASVFTKKNLKKYAAIIFLNTTGDILNEEQQAVFENYIRSGKGFVGIHAATDTEYGWPWYVKLIGGSFESHPNTQPAKLVVTDPQHPATRHLPATWSRTDEWYNFKNRNTSVKVVLRIDETSYQGGKNGSDHPMAWYHEYEGGRIFYTALGHTDESYKEEAFIQHLLGGIKYALGK
jgi:type 1 glutamine amidotransferase